MLKDTKPQIEAGKPTAVIAISDKITETVVRRAFFVKMPVKGSG
jgi:hypothetical protein